MLNLCRLVNDALQRRKRKKDIARRLPVERTQGEIIILPLTDGKLFCKIVKRIETMRSIEFLVVFSMTAFNLAVMSGCERSDLLMLDSQLFKRFLEEGRQLLLAVPQLICKLKSVMSERILWRMGTSPLRASGKRWRYMCLFP